MLPTQFLCVSHRGHPSALVEVKPLNQWQAVAFKSDQQGSGELSPWDISLLSLSVQKSTLAIPKYNVK